MDTMESQEKKSTGVKPWIAASRTFLRYLAHPSASRKNWLQILVRVGVPAGISVLLFLFMGLGVSLPQLERSLMKAKETTVREQVHTVQALLQTFQQKERRGELTRTEAQRQARDLIRELRYGPLGDNYFVVYDLDQNCIVHPLLPKLEGTSQAQVTDSNKFHYIQAFVEKAQQPGGGLVHYTTSRTRNEIRESYQPKLAYVELFEPWGWVVGTGIYIDDVREEFAATHHRTLMFYGLILLALLATVGYSVWQEVRAIRLRLRAEEERSESEARFRMLVEQAPEAILVFDIGSRLFVDANANAERLWGVNRGELIGKTIEALFPGQLPNSSPLAELVHQHIRKATVGKTVVFDQQVRDAQGHDKFCEVRLTKMPVARRNWFRLSYIDVSERKRAEQDLQQYKDHLEELVDLRTAELSEARDQAQAANRAKSAFLANMSHELRTPLTAVIGFAQMMSHNPTTSNRERASLDIILRSGEHLLALINDILDLSKIEAGRIGLDHTDLNLDELLRDVTDMMRGRAEAKGLRLIVQKNADFPHFINTDPGKFRQIIINLVGNAIKFTNAGQIEIRLDAKRISEGHLLNIAVADTGIGISKADLDLVFQPFVQAQTERHRVTEGTGLGLAISRQYAQMLGGSLSVDSEPGKGSCFHLTIPVGGVDAGSIQALASRPRVVGIESPTDGFRVLVAEDQPENRLLLRSFLEQFGFQTREAVNGEEAIAAFQAWQPHLILMDRRMPVLDGIGAIRRIRALPDGQEVLIIAVSAHTFKEEQQEMLDAGCNGFLCKPFSIGDLLTLLGQHLHLTLRHAEKPAIARILVSDDLRPVPVPKLKTLHRLILEGQHDEIIAWVNGQILLDAEIREALLRLLDDYQFEILANIIEPLLEGK